MSKAKRGLCKNPDIQQCCSKYSKALALFQKKS